MKHLSNLFSVLCFLALGHCLQAQNTCCDASTVAPQITTGFYSTQVAGSASTPGVTLSVNASADLTDVEYVVTKRNALAVDNNGVVDSTDGQPSGPVIIGSTISGIFVPDNLGRYGVTLNAGDTFDVTAVGYDLALLKVLADSLLNGKNASGNPCCDLFQLIALLPGNDPSIAGFCDSVRGNGVNGAADINNFNDVLVVFDAFGGGQTSLASVLSTLQLINSYGSFITSDCGGTGSNDFLPYGVDPSASYGYDREGTVAVQELSKLSLFMVYPNPASEQVMLRFKTEQSLDLTINIYNALGQRVYNQATLDVSGDHNITIATSALNAGIYTLELTDGNTSKTQRLVIQ
jgi:hypothetical protein